MHIPTIKARFALSDAVLSLALFAIAIGAILVMGPLGRWVARRGSATACRQATVPFALTTALLLLTPSFWLLLPLLLAFGASMAAFDVAMNAQAATVEAKAPRPVMSSLHGMYSLGGMVGAAIGGLLLGWHVPPRLHGLGMAAIIVLTTQLAAPRLLAEASTTATAAPPQRHHSHTTLWWLGGLAFLGMVGEGAMYDWTTVYMRDVTASAAATASAGYAAFSGGMALGRFAGDRLRARFGAVSLLVMSAWLGFTGILLAILWPVPAAALLGFAMMGLGMANMIPVFFVAASRLQGISAAEGIASVSRAAYVGMLLGPVMIGSVAHLTQLRLGLGVVAIAVGIVALCGRPVLARATRRPVS
ncbi:MFS transporter [Paludibacterium denitrificans]|uniref:MFS transporter n=1 Tax=Paludibacterium denitrificans TaxID=2675226 RepID=UPI001E4EAC2D|nr:MFS transporter [Paludibacterium denitrificans]